MPHLQFCGRYWRIAGDELSFPGVCAIIGRILCITILFVILGISSISDCSSGVTTYLSLSTFLLILSILCEALIIRISLQGTMVEAHRRSGLGKVLHFHGFLGLAEFGIAVFGISVVENSVRFPCLSDNFQQPTDIILLSVMVISQLIDVMALLCCCYCLSANRINDPILVDDERWANTLWEKWCKTLCHSLQLCTCNIFGGGNVAEDLNKVAKILTAFSHHEGFLDVVPSDVVAGILLLRLQQRKQRTFFIEDDDIESHRSPSFFPLSSDTVCREELLSISPELRRRYVGHAKRRQLDKTQTSDHELLKDIAHFSVFAMAIYSHLMLIFINPCSGFCQLISSWLSLDSRRTTHKPLIRGDNCFSVNEAAVIQMTKPVKRDLIFASFENSVHAKPYAVFLDHDARKVVVTIRGTLGLEDWITDGISDSVELVVAQQWGFDGRNRFGHEGFVTAALRIRQELETNSTLQRVFAGYTPESSKRESSSLHAPLTADAFGLSRYPIVVVGHSLGAGVAVLLSLFLRNAFPDVRCFGYGMPGAVVDDRTARECSSFVTSVILGTDMVPRMSFRALTDMREEVLDAIARARVSKSAILKTLIFEDDVNVDDFLYRPGEEPPSKFKNMIASYSTHVGQRARLMHPLCLPGRIIHYAKIEKTRRRRWSFFCQKVEYTPFETSWEAFTELHISSTMLTDHFFDRIHAEVRSRIDKRR